MCCAPFCALFDQYAIPASVGFLFTDFFVYLKIRQTSVLYEPAHIACTVLLAISTQLASHYILGWKLSVLHTKYHISRLVKALNRRARAYDLQAAMSIIIGSVPEFN